jgi:hypothetical protein
MFRESPRGEWERKVTMKRLFAIGVALSILPLPSLAKKPEAKKAAAPVKEAAPQTVRAISELMGKFKWDMSPDEAMKIVTEDIGARFDEKIQKETIPAKQDKILREKNDALTKMKESYVHFSGEKTGWDVSIIDREFAHNNDESMLVIWEKDQRRFLFFWHDKLWKQFIAFNAENPIFRDKTFDDFADIIQRRYGPAAMTFRKQRTSDEQTLDHLEWPPAGDYILWAIDLTTFYGNFCLSLQRKAIVPEIEKARDQNSPRRNGPNAVIEAITKGNEVKQDENADIVDEITGRSTQHVDQPVADTKPDKKGRKKGAAAEVKEAPKKHDKVSDDPLDGTNF